MTTETGGGRQLAVRLKTAKKRTTSQQKWLERQLNDPYVARAMVPYMAEMGLTAAFRDKGRFGSFMENFALFAVEDDFAALTGCAAHLAAGGRG